MAIELELPSELAKQIQVMRRNPAEFSVVRKVQCKFGCGKQSAFALTHPDSKDVGSWCPTHGWLSFDSATVRPIGEEYTPTKRARKAA